MHSEWPEVIILSFEHFKYKRVTAVYQYIVNKWEVLEPLKVLVYSSLFKSILIWKQAISTMTPDKGNSYSLHAGTFCMPFCCLLNFYDFFKERNTIGVSDSLDPDHAQHFVRPDLVPNCLQRLSAEDTSLYDMISKTMVIPIYLYKAGWRCMCSIIKNPGSKSSP